MSDEKQSDEKQSDENAGDQPEILFTESGASWLWVLAGPAAGLTMLLLQLKGGAGIQLALPMLFLVLVSGFVALQIYAARIHTGVELTRELLRQGAEVIPVDTIVGVYPEKKRRLKPDDPKEKWLSARSMGELSRVPRGRTAIGVALAGGGTARAWARRHRDLRAALTKLVGEVDDGSGAAGE